MQVDKTPNPCRDAVQPACWYCLRGPLGRERSLTLLGWHWCRIEVCRGLLRTDLTSTRCRVVRQVVFRALVPPDKISTRPPRRDTARLIRDPPVWASSHGAPLCRLWQGPGISASGALLPAGISSRYSRRGSQGQGELMHHMALWQPLLRLGFPL